MDFAIIARALTVEHREKTSLTARHKYYILPIINVPFASLSYFHPSHAQLESLRFPCKQLTLPVPLSPFASTT